MTRPYHKRKWIQYFHFGKREETINVKANSETDILKATNRIQRKGNSGEMGSGGQAELANNSSETKETISETKIESATCDSPSSVAAGLSSQARFLHFEPRRRGMPPKSLSRRGSRRFNCSDSELSLFKHTGGEDDNIERSHFNCRRGLPPKTLSRGGSRRLLRSENDLSLEATNTTSDLLLGNCENGLLLEAKRTTSDFLLAASDQRRESEEPLDGNTSMKLSFLDGLLEEDEDEQATAEREEEEGMDDILSDSLRGIKRHRRRALQREAD